MSPQDTLPVSVLVDVNVFEDVYRRRRGWRASAAVLTTVRRGLVVGHVSALTPALLYFFRSQYHPEEEARRLVQSILKGFRIAPVTEETLRDAYSSSLPDFEDAIQHACAVAATASYIVTRNLADYTGSRIPTLSPEGFLRLLPGGKRHGASQPEG